MPLTSAQIAAAKKSTPYNGSDRLHEHDDCIRIAYEWLDAQVKTKGVMRKAYALKHIIEKWGGRYVSSSDVEVAAHMHPAIHGRYPYFNISSRLTKPNARRLKSIGEAGTQENYSRKTQKELYTVDEP